MDTISTLTETLTRFVRTISPHRSRLDPFLTLWGRVSAF